jgi:electron transfer flavoprotein beta subunit
MGAKKKPQETVSAEAVAPGTTVVELSPPPPRGDSVRIDDDGSAAEKIVEYLAGKRLI